MEIEFTSRLSLELGKYIEKDDYLLVTDENIYNLYKVFIGDTLKNHRNILVLKPGEENKNIVSLSKIYEKLLKLNLSRDGYIISLGGGVVGDISGFAAATYKRGVNYIQVPTTLLAQVDSSVGGKTAIDFGGVKNLIGSFHFPERVYIDSRFINTLPDREILSGLGEILKYGLISDYEMFQYIKRNLTRIFERDLEVIEELIRKSITIKSSIVEEDRFDQGKRRILNFGHTIGHGIESFFNYSKYNHGEAVIKGILYEVRIAYNRKLISLEYMNSIEELIRPLVRKENYTEEDVLKIIKYMENDKKNKGGKIGFILPVGQGLVDIFHDVSDKEIKKVMLGVE